MDFSKPGQFLFKNLLLKGDVLILGADLEKDFEGYKNLKLQVNFYTDYLKDQKFDTIICSFLQSPFADKVLFELSILLKHGGKAYFYSWVKELELNLSFRSIVKLEEIEILEYQHYSFLNRGNGKISPFFADNETKLQIGEIAAAFAIRDKFPVSEGHSLIIPKSIQSNYFNLSFQEQTSCWLLVNLIQQDLLEKYNPSGFNIGININETAGQTVPHCHIHIIPRYVGDVVSPRGGVRGVIPDKREY